MKKVFLMILVSILSAFLLVSCGNKDTDDNTPPKEPTTAAELWEKINGKMSSLSSYDMTFYNNLLFYMQGYEVKSIVEGSISEIDKGYNDYYYNGWAVTKMQCFGIDLDSTIIEREVFDEGEYYLHYSENNFNADIEQKLRAKTSAVNFIVYKREKYESEFDVLDCTDANIQKNPDGTWILNCSGYTKKTIDNYIKEEEIDALFDVEIVDINVSVLADCNFCVTEMKMDFVFDLDENSTVSPKIEVVNTYSNHDAVEKDISEIDKEDYTVVSDILILYEIQDQIEKLQSLKEGAFIYDVSQKILYQSRKEPLYSETDTVTYGEKNGKYYYNAVAEIFGKDGTSEVIEIDYENGYQTVTQGKDSYDSPQSEDEARGFINNLIFEGVLNVGYVADVRRTDDGSYEIEYAYINPAPYQALFDSIGAYYISVTKTVCITMDGDGIEEIKSKIVATGRRNTSVVSVHIDTVTNFDVDVTDNNSDTPDQDL